MDPADVRLGDRVDPRDTDDKDPEASHHVPHELLERLVPLIPPPRAHQVRYHGVLAPCASARDRIVPGPRLARGADVDGSVAKERNIERMAGRWLDLGNAREAASSRMIREQNDPKAR